MIQIAIYGCCGRMGQRIMELADADPEVCVIAALEKRKHPQLGAKIGSIVISDDLHLIKDADVVIDFSWSSATMELLDVAVEYKKALVIGTTGMQTEQVERIKTAASEISIVFAPNMSIGVNILFRIVKEAAKKLTSYNIKIKEAHHIHKKDAPSGTAKKIAQIIKDQTAKEVKDIASIRKDEIIGDHEITFESDVDTIILSHSAKTRDIFAKGALEAAKWVVKQSAGMFSMQDVIGK